MPLLLGETNAQMSRMTEELSGKSDELIRYQEEISSLLSQIVDLQHKLKEVCALTRQPGWAEHRPGALHSAKGCHTKQSRPGSPPFQWFTLFF